MREGFQAVLYTISKDTASSSWRQGIQSLTDTGPPYQRWDLRPSLQPSQHLLPCCLLRFYALIPSPLYPPPPLSSETALPIPPPPSSALAPASIPLALLPNLCLPTAFIRPASYHFTHRYAHNLFPPLPSLPSPQHPQRLPSLGYPSLYLLLVKLVKHFCWMLSSYFQWPCYTYLALGG